jgi:hypothetical protein
VLFSLSGLVNIGQRPIGEVKEEEREGKRGEEEEGKKRREGSLLAYSVLVSRRKRFSLSPSLSLRSHPHLTHYN